MWKSSPKPQRHVDRAAENAHDTVTRLHERAAKVEDEILAAAGAMVAGSQEPADLELTNMEDAVRSVVKYVQENPFAASAMALGAGVVLTSMYWSQLSDARATE